MIEAHGLTKQYGTKTAVDDVSFTIRPGSVTGFLGPNGAGKSTTMRMIMGLDAPTRGTVTVNGKPYAQHRAPLTEVGALLEARAVHPGRSAFNHLYSLAATHGIGKARVQEVIDMTGLQAVAKKRVGGFSLGMGQRLGIAVALLGDPQTLILDEPVNGLDPEGVRWVRNLARYLASQGRTVFLSSHLMSEVAQTADHVLIIGRGRILADASVPDFIRTHSRQSVRVRSPQVTELAAALAGPGVTVEPGDEPGLIDVEGLEPAAIGDVAAAGGFTLHELSPVVTTLEQAYMELTQDAVEYQTATTGEPVAAPPATESGAPVAPEAVPTTSEENR